MYSSFSQYIKKNQNDVNFHKKSKNNSMSRVISLINHKDRLIAEYKELATLSKPQKTFVVYTNIQEVLYKLALVYADMNAYRLAKDVLLFVIEISEKMEKKFSVSQAHIKNSLRRDIELMVDRFDRYCVQAYCRNEYNSTDGLNEWL